MTGYKTCKYCNKKGVTPKDNSKLPPGQYYTERCKYCGKIQERN